MRLPHSISAAHLLYRLGHNFEADAVSRQILEQIAWSFAVRNLDSMEAIQRSSPTAAIGVMARSWAPVGPLYGELSRAVHLNLDEHRSIVRPPPDYSITITQRRFARAAGYLLVLADLWTMVWEWTHCVGHEPDLRTIENVPDFTPREDREFRSTMLEVLDRIVETAHDETEFEPG